MQLANNLQGHRSRATASQPSLLAGKLFDAAGERLTPSHANKKGRRYRYYVLQRFVRESGTERGRMRIPAAEIEAVVFTAIRDLLADASRLLGILGMESLRPSAAKEYVVRAKAFGTSLKEPGKNPTAKWQDLIDRVTIGEADVTIALSPSGLSQTLAVTDRHVTGRKEDLVIRVPAVLKRCGVMMKVIVGDSMFRQPAKSDPALVKLVTRAHDWFERLIDGRADDLEQIARVEHLGATYVGRVLHVVHLAPDIVDAILDGRQPADLTAQRLLFSLPLPFAWADQREILGFQ